MTTTQASQIGSYKGRQYRILFCGKTKYGFRARLQFMDGSKDFWVAANLVSREEESAYAPAVRDSRGYVTDRGHHAGYCGYPCPVTGKRCCPTNGPCHDCE
jgi:hypothetical protein